jgi:glycosyltransferase involved in cell wall biosynthesis
VHKVLALRDGPMRERFVAAGIEVETVASPGAAFGALRRLRQVTGDWQPDVIQGWMYHGNLAATLAGGLRRRQRVVWNVRQALYDLTQEKPLTRVTIRACRWLSALPAAIVYNSRLSMSQHEQFGFARRHSAYIGNGIDTALLHPDAEQRVRLRTAQGLNERFVVGMAARRHPVKAHDVLLRAVAKCVQRIPELTVLLAGRDLAADPALARLLDELQLRDRVRFVGELREMAPFYHCLDVCALSSWAEAFPNVLVEAMAHGVPCISTRVGDAEQVIGDTGYSVPPGDYQALADAIQAVAGMSKPERQQLGLRARARAVEHFDMGAVRQSYQQLYTRVAAGQQELN